MKRRLIAAVSMLLFLSCFAILGAYNAHQLMTRQMLFSWNGIICLKAVISVPLVRMWFLLLEGLAVTAVVWMTVGREYIKYKSKMHHVCLDIYTPEADGQGQYGTARWMTDREVETAFTTVQIDYMTPMIRELMAHGRDDLEGGNDGEAV